MPRALDVTSEDWRKMLEKHPLVDMLNPLAKEELKVIILERMLIEEEAKPKALLATPDGTQSETELDRVVAAAWAKDG